MAGAEKANPQPPAGERAAKKAAFNTEKPANYTKPRRDNREPLRDAKPFYKSLTVWVNIISVIAIVVEQQLDLLKPIMDDTSYALLAIAVASINLYLRLYSHRPLEIRKKKHECSEDNNSDRL